MNIPCRHAFLHLLSPFHLVFLLSSLHLFFLLPSLHLFFLHSSLHLDFLHFSVLSNKECKESKKIKFKRRGKTKHKTVCKNYGRLKLLNDGK